MADALSGSGTCAPRCSRRRLRILGRGCSRPTRPPPAFACEAQLRRPARKVRHCRPTTARRRCVSCVPDRFRLEWVQKDFHGRSGTSVIYTERGRDLFPRTGRERPAEVGGRTLAGAGDQQSCAGISLGTVLSRARAAAQRSGLPDFRRVAAGSRRQQRGRPAVLEVVWQDRRRRAVGTAHRPRNVRVARGDGNQRSSRPVTAAQVRDAVGKESPGSGQRAAPPPRAILTRYRFTTSASPIRCPTARSPTPRPPEEKKR